MRDIESKIAPGDRTRLEPGFGTTLKLCVITTIVCSLLEYLLHGFGLLGLIFAKYAVASIVAAAAHHIAVRNQIQSNLGITMIISLSLIMGMTGGVDKANLYDAALFIPICVVVSTTAIVGSAYLELMRK